MANDNPNPVVENNQQAAAAAEKPPTERETIQARDDAARDGAAQSMQSEVMESREQFGNTLGGDGSALTQHQENGAYSRNPYEMTEAQRAEAGIKVGEDGKLIGSDGKPINDPRATAGETNPENIALVQGPNGETRVDLDLETGVEPFDGAEESAEYQAPKPPTELGESGEAVDPTTGEVPTKTRTAKAESGIGGETGGDIENKITDGESEVYRERGTATEPVAGTQAGRRPGEAEVSTGQDQAETAPGAAVTPAAGTGTTTTLNDAGPAAAAAGGDAALRSVAPGVSTEAAAFNSGDRPAEASTEAAAGSPEARIAENRRILDANFKDSPHEAQVTRDLNTFLARNDITAEQKAQALENLAATTQGKFIDGNGSRSGMEKRDVDSAVAGGINDIAKPRNIDQGNNGTCNVTVLQEGVAGADPARYTSSLREAALHGTYTGSDGFKARIPSDMLKPHREAADAQDVDGKRNFSSQIMQGGILNHHWQQKGQYFTDTDGGGEQRYKFDTSVNNADAIRNGANPFTNQFVGSGAGVGANEVGFMGRNFGIQGQFVFAQQSWLDGQPPDPSVKVVGSAAELTAAKEQRARETGSDWSVAVVHSGNGLFTGSDGLGGSGGGHVVSSYRNGDLSNQWGGQFDRTGVSDKALFAAMDMDPRTRSDGSKGRPSGQFDDTTLPDRYDEHRRTNPNAHGDNIKVPGAKEEDLREKNKEEEKKRAEEEGKKEGNLNDGSGNRRAGLMSTRERLMAQIDQARESARQINDGLAVDKTAALFSQLAGVNTDISRIA